MVGRTVLKDQGPIVLVAKLGKLAANGSGGRVGVDSQLKPRPRAWAKQGRYSDKWKVCLAYPLLPSRRYQMLGTLP